MSCIFMSSNFCCSVRLFHVLQFHVQHFQRPRSTQGVLYNSNWRDSPRSSHTLVGLPTAVCTLQRCTVTAQQLALYDEIAHKICNDCRKNKRTLYSYIGLQGTILITDFYKFTKASKLLQCHTIDTDSFLDDLKSSPVITNPQAPESLDPLLVAYNTTLSSLLYQDVPVITKLSKRKSRSNPWFTATLRAFRSTVRRAENFRKRTYSALDRSSFKSLNQYQKQYFSNLVSSVSDNPKRLWKTVNNLLHRKSSPLPTSTPGSSLADSFANFFTDKSSKLHISVTSNTSTSSKVTIISFLQHPT